jgi:hypothetical protein
MDINFNSPFFLIPAIIALSLTIGINVLIWHWGNAFSGDDLQNKPRSKSDTE